jgi:hypothetical protein
LQAALDEGWRDWIGGEEWELKGGSFREKMDIAVLTLGFLGSTSSNTPDSPRW